MQSTLLAAVVAALASIIVAALTFFLTKRYELKKEWQQQKLNHYRTLLSSLSDLAVDGKNHEKANTDFALAVNTIALVAPQYVIEALMAFHDEVKWSNPDKSPAGHDERLKQLLLAIRKDIGLSAKDDSTSFNFHLIGSSPPPSGLGGKTQHHR